MGLQVSYRLQITYLPPLWPNAARYFKTAAIYCGLKETAGKSAENCPSADLSIAGLTGHG